MADIARLRAAQFSRVGRSSCSGSAGRRRAERRRRSCGGAASGDAAVARRGPALMVAIGFPSRRQAQQINHRADRQDVPGIADQQRDEEHHRDEHRQHHFRRHPHPHRLAGEHRQPRHHQERDHQRIERGQHRRRLRHAEKRQIDRQQHGDRAGRRRHAGEVIRRKGRLVRIVHGGVEARQPQAAADREHHRRDPAAIVRVHAAARNTGSGRARRRN